MSSPTHAPDPLISALKHECRVSQGFCRSLTEKEGAFEAPVISFGGPNVVQEMSSRSSKEGFGDHHSSRGLLANVLQLSCPINRNGRHRNALLRLRDCSSSHGFPRSCLTRGLLTCPKSCRLTPTPSERGPKSARALGRLNNLQRGHFHQLSSFEHNSECKSVASM